MKRSLVALLTLALFACSGASGTEGALEDGAEVSEAELASTPLQRAEALVALLNQPGSLVMPPIAVENHANEMTAKAEVVDFDGNFQKALEARIADSIDYYGGTVAGGTFSMTANPDTHFTVEFGFENASIKSALKQGVVAEAKRRSVAARLPHLVGTYARLSVYNAGAEIVGDEVILLQPYALQNKIIVVHVSYVHS